MPYAGAVGSGTELGGGTDDALGGNEGRGDEVALDVKVGGAEVEGSSVGPSVGGVVGVGVGPSVGVAVGPRVAVGVAVAAGVSWTKIDSEETA
jgi:hypothetical protein